MKKTIILAALLIPALSAFAYGHSNYDDEMSSFSIFILIVMIAYIVLSIVFLVRWWNMTRNVDEIRQILSQENPKLTYLVAIGEKEQAQKAALKLLVDELYPIYWVQYNMNKAESMNEIISYHLPKMEKLGLSMPEYVQSGENFIDYLNGLTGNTVQYKETSH